MRFLVIASALLFLVLNPALASERCKEKAQSALELREDYKTLAEFEGYYIGESANLRVVKSAGGFTANREADLEQSRLLAIEIFRIHKGAKGANLHKQVLTSCVALDKADAERTARQESRAAAKAAREKAANN